MNTTLVFALICAVAFQEGSAQLIQRFGALDNSDSLVFQERKNISWTKFSGGYDITYPAPGLLKLYNITEVRVKDWSENEPKITFTSGGVGHLSAKISISQAIFYGIDVTVNIFGKFVGPCTPST